MFAETILLHSSSLGFVVVCVFFGGMKDEGVRSERKRGKRKKRVRQRGKQKRKSKQGKEKESREKKKDGWKDESYFLGRTWVLGRGEGAGWEEENVEEFLRTRRDERNGEVRGGSLEKVKGCVGCFCFPRPSCAQSNKLKCRPRKKKLANLGAFVSTR